ncbi:MAG: hypothetical protein C0625_12555 [Arcobacter sp.]|nr:MAG: hypothetical protein C0625_12555 [Arcobacter sp.]
MLLFGILLSIGVLLFLVPNSTIASGTPRLVILVIFFINYQLGVIMFCINFPLVLIRMYYISKSYSIRTIFSISVTFLI